LAQKTLNLNIPKQIFLIAADTHLRRLYPRRTEWMSSELMLPLAMLSIYIILVSVQNGDLELDKPTGKWF
jgi:hypothetical protein